MKEYKKMITNMRSQETIKLKRGTDKPKRARKIASMIKSINQ
jgi:hypothetical protein